MENGVELHLLCINTKKHFKPDSGVSPEFRTAAHYHSVYRNTNTSLVGAFLNLFSSESYFVSRFRFKAFEDKLKELLNSGSFDIVQLEGLFMGVYIPCIRQQSRSKIILRAHNIEHFIWNRHVLLEKNPIKKFYLKLQNTRLKRFEKQVISKADALVTITTHDAAEFSRMIPGKPLFTCITGVDIKTYQQQVNVTLKPKTIFYFGSMDWLPNSEAVLWFLDKCWDKVHKAVPDSRFVIAGQGMPEQFKRLNKPNVILVESVPDAAMFYRQHELMIVPLWSGSGLRIKIIEGMAFGKAIVSTSIGAEGIAYSEGQNIRIADNGDDFAKAVIDLLQHPERRKALEKEAAEFARKEFDNARVVAPLVNFYKQLLHA